MDLCDLVGGMLLGSAVERLWRSRARVVAWE